MSNGVLYVVMGSAKDVPALLPQATALIPGLRFASTPAKTDFQQIPMRER